MSSIFVLRATEEGFPSEVYASESAAFECFSEWPDEYEVYRLSPDKRWDNITRQWTAVLAREELARNGPGWDHFNDMKQGR